MRQLRVLDLFSGIGGFSLGLERAGMKTAAFCEINPFRRRVLAQHWPDVPIYDDVQTLTADTLCRDGIAVDGICGGFPCQDVSYAGRRAGLETERSGLWREYARLVSEIRPRFAIVENTPGLLSLGMGRVLGDLAAIGYDAVWDCIPGCAVGARHERDRVWIMAYPHDEGEFACAVYDKMAQTQNVASNAHEARRAHAERGARSTPHGREVIAADPIGRWASEWPAEPEMVRNVHGVPADVDAVKALGDAVIPAIPELLGYAILEALW